MVCCVVSGPSCWCAHSGRLSGRTQSSSPWLESVVIVVVLTAVNRICRADVAAETVSDERQCAVGQLMMEDLRKMREDYFGTFRVDPNVVVDLVGRDIVR